MSLVDKLLQKPENATFADERQFWSIEKASNGQKYYFNKKTKESQWEKPECLKTEEEKENQTDWLECTKQDGRIFYYNTKSKKSQWQIPEELKVLRQQQAERRKIREQQGLGDQDDDDNEFKISDEQKKEIDQRNFLEMLRENKVNNQMKWDQAQNLMQNDQRWIKIKQISEKKRLFQDYIQKIKRIERQEQQNKSEKAKEDFFKLLEESNLNSDSKFYKVLPTLIPDPRYKNLEEKHRETYFQDFIDKLYENELDQMKDERRIHTDYLKKKLHDVIDLSTSFKWADFQSKFKHDESFKKLNEYDRIYIFSDVIQDLQKAENDERRKTKRRNERINRENFRELLKSKIAQGEIDHKTKWKNFVQTIKDTPEFLNMIDQSGSQPHELFEDQQDLLIENHKAMKAEIKQHIKQSGMKVVVDITYKEFIEKMKQLSVFDTLEEYLKNFYYHYFIQKARLKEKETQKKHKKAQRKYLKFLKTLQELNKDSQYKDFQDIITKGLGEEINAQIPLIEREEIFKEYVATLDPNYKDLYSDQEGAAYHHNKNNNSSNSTNTTNHQQIPHNPPNINKHEPSPHKKTQPNNKGNAEEGEEGEIPENEKKQKNKSDEEDGEQEEGEDKDSESEQKKDKKKKKSSSHRHRDHHSTRNKSKRSRSRSNSRSRQDKKNKKKDKKKKKSHKHSRSNSSSN